MKDENPKNFLYTQNWLPKHLMKIINSLLFHFSTSQQPVNTLCKHLNLQSHEIVSVTIFSSISISIQNNFKTSLEISKVLILPVDEGNGYMKSDVPKG